MSKISINTLRTSIIYLSVIKISYKIKNMTGYTSELVAKGLTFPEFVLSCARAMAPLMHMRDDSYDAPIRLRPESDYGESRHVKEKAKAEERLEELAALDGNERLGYGECARTSAIQSAKEHLEQCERENAVFEGMRKEVLDWVPPTSEHQDLKDFMLQQLEISITDTDYHKRALLEATSKSVVDFYKGAVECENLSIAYHVRCLMEEEKKPKFDSNAWIIDLFKSLDLAPPEPCQKN